MMKRISIFLCLLELFFLSCQDSRGSRENISHAIYELGLQIAGRDTYKGVLVQANDSIQNWAKNGLKMWVVDSSTIDFQMDTLICFNTSVNKAVMANMGRQLTPIGKLDAIGFFYGVKINDGWYFFSGPTAYIPRDEDSLNSPTSFTKLHEIAMKEVFRGYLKKKDLGFWRNVFGKAEYEVNEGWFKQMEDKNAPSAGYGSCFNCKTVEEYGLFRSKSNWLSAFRSVDVKSLKVSLKKKKLKIKFPLKPFYPPHIYPMSVEISYRSDSTQNWKLLDLKRDLPLKQINSYSAEFSDLFIREPTFQLKIWVRYSGVVGNDNAPKAVVVFNSTSGKIEKTVYLSPGDDKQ